MGKEVLVVDDNDFDLIIVRDVLEQNDFSVTTVKSSVEALKLIRQGHTQFEIIILDWVMPAPDGIELCKTIRNIELKIHPYILILTANNSEIAELEALYAGADDFIEKPFDKQKLLARMMVARRMMRYQKKMVNLAYTDPLTSLFNRRYGLILIENQLKYIRRKSHIENCIVVCDIDYFKRINDTYGHCVGDNVILSVSKILRTHLREYENITRMGGEEFLFMLDANANEAVSIITRLMDSFNEMRSYGAKDEFHVTLSFGCLELTKENNSLPMDELINKADQLLYKAKEEGRNRLVISGSDGSMENIILNSKPLPHFKDTMSGL